MILLVIREIYMNIIRNGLFNALDDGYSHQFACWILIYGVFIIHIGQTLHYY